MTPPDEAPPPASIAARPPRVEPPSGWKVALVLIAVLVGICASCVGLAVGYAYYLDIRAAR